MDSIYLKIAGFVIKLELKGYKGGKPVQDFFKKILSKYLAGFVINSSKVEDYCIEIIEKPHFEFLFEINLDKNYLFLYESISPKRIRTFYYISYQQIQIIIRSICQKLLVKNKGLMVHASASLIDGKAYIFLGQSGAGKSTIVKILSAKYHPLADDMLIVKLEDGKPYLYQVPFVERNFIQNKNLERYEIGGFYFLQKSLIQKQELVENKEEIIQRFIEQLFSEEEDKTMQIDSLFELISIFNNFNYLYFSLKRQKELMELIK